MWGKEQLCKRWNTFLPVKCIGPVGTRLGGEIHFKILPFNCGCHVLPKKRDFTSSGLCCSLPRTSIEMFF